MAETSIEIIPESIKLVKITDEEYFSKEYGDWISNSKLGLVNPDEGGSLEKYRAGYSGSYSESFELGSAVHAMVLQPDEYNIAPIRKPTGKLGLFAEKSYELIRKTKVMSADVMNDIIKKASLDADYYAGKLADKRLETALAACEPYWKDRKEYEYLIDKEISKKQLYLSAPMHEKFRQCMLGVTSNTKVGNILKPETLLGSAEVYNEYALFAEVIVTLEDGTTKRLKLKSKLDNFTVNHETQELTLNDLKTTGKPVVFFMGGYKEETDPVTGRDERNWYDGSFQKYHYYRQMGMYLWLLACYYKHKGINYTPKANMVVVETIPKFRTRICSVNGKYIKQGLDEFKKLLILVANG